MADLTSIIPGGFNSEAVEPQQPMSGEPLPAGAYTVEITNAEVKDLRSGNGTGLNIEFTVIDPQPFARRKIWQNLNIRHTNPQAEQIAQSQLSALCRAVGIGVLTDSDHLFQKLLRVNVKIRPAQGDYAARNEVTGYESAGAATTAKPAAPAASAAKPAAPWAKKAA